MSRRLKIVLLSVLGVIVLGVGAIYAYILWIRDDAPPALTTDDLDEALAGDTTVATDSSDASTSDSAGTTTGDSTTGPAATTGSAGDSGDSADPSGTWAISTDSTVGYRVSEVLFGVDTEGAGRTNQVTGTLVIDGTTATSGEFSVDMATITSDDSRRDGQFRGRIMSVDEFPTATFTLTQPIDFGTAPSEGQTVTATATGDLTLRGVTNSVTFDVDAKLEGGRIGVLGSIPIKFSDYDIPDPSNQAAEVKDDGLLEFVLVFDRA
jgi:polyisoprenoid-binding protein YceI